jgi:hypothetical protein
MEFLDFFNFFLNSNWEDILVIFLLYNFFKFLIMSGFIEIIWATQYFNRKHNVGYLAYKMRTYTETMLKLRNSSNFQKVLNFFFIKYYF